MDKDQSRGQDSVYSNKVRAGKRRTYFFDVRQTKGEDYYITLTESTKRFNGEGYSRHKIFLYKEDFNRFMNGLQDAVDHVKHELMPDYDYEQFDRRQEEWDKQQALEAQKQSSTEDAPVVDSTESKTEDADSDNTEADHQDPETLDINDEDEDMSW